MASVGYEEKNDVMINHIVSGCIKLIQKEYKICQDWVAKVIYCELCKRLKFKHSTKFVIHNQKVDLESGFGGSTRPQSENIRKWNDRQTIETCQKNK